MKNKTHKHNETCTTKNCAELEKQGIDRAENYKPQHTPTPNCTCTSTGNEHERGCFLYGYTPNGMPQHTPTPLSKDRIAFLEIIATKYFSPSDAAFIVRAVNAHEELLKLVKDLNYAFYAVGTPKAMKEVMARSKEIIAKAEGKSNE